MFCNFAFNTCNDEVFSSGNFGRASPAFGALHWCEGSYLIGNVRINYGLTLKLTVSAEKSPFDSFNPQLCAFQNRVSASNLKIKYQLFRDEKSELSHLYIYGRNSRHVVVLRCFESSINNGTCGGEFVQFATPIRRCMEFC